MAHVVLGVNRLHPLIIREVNSTLNGNHIIFDGGLDAVAINARHFKHDCQCLGSLENVRHWHEYPPRRCGFGLLFNLALLLDLQFL